MATVPDDLRYAPTHEWVRVKGDVGTIGITDHAQEELGDITYVGLPEPGRILQPGELFGEVESIKAVSELFTPVGGEVIEVNAPVAEATETVNEDPYGRGWLVRVRITDTSALFRLLSPEAYRVHTAGGH